MSTITSTAAIPQSRRSAAEVFHSLGLWVSALGGMALTLALTVYGFGYYTLGQAERVYSPKHVLLRPSGVLGIRLGFLGLAFFLLLFLYAIRKSVKSLSRIGNTRRWLNFHVILGIMAPVVVTFHSSFKFKGLAGIAYWIMIAVAVSGVVGRYIYAQIPRSIGAAELSKKELSEQSGRLAERLKSQEVLAPGDFAGLLRLPAASEVDSMSAMAVLAYMMRYDVTRFWQLAGLRRKALRSFRGRAALWGLVRSHHAQVESVIDCLKEEAFLEKKILFLSKAQEIFQLWHVVHRPFSYSFVVLAGIHIVVALMFGYY